MKSRQILLLLSAGHELTRDTLPKNFEFAFGTDTSEKKQAPSFNSVRAARIKLVLVDDDLLIRSTYETILKKQGFDVRAVMSDGKELLERIDSINPKPDVIVMDERMPGISGVETCGIIRAKYPDVVVVFVSADAGAKDRALRAGAKSFLTKPVTTAALVAAIVSP